MRGKKLVNTSALASALTNVTNANQSKFGNIFSGIYGGVSAAPTPSVPNASVSPIVSNHNTAPSKSSKTLIDLVIETISKCSDEYDDNVQIQVIKALLTAITSLHCEVPMQSIVVFILHLEDARYRCTKLLFFWLCVLAFTFT